VSPTIYVEYKPCSGSAAQRSYAAGSGQQRAHIPNRETARPPVPSLKHGAQHKNPGSFIASCTSRIRGVSCGVFVSRARYCRLASAPFFTKPDIRPTASLLGRTGGMVFGCIHISGRDCFQAGLQTPATRWPAIWLPKCRFVTLADRFDESDPVDSGQLFFDIDTFDEGFDRQDSDVASDGLHHPAGTVQAFAGKIFHTGCLAPVAHLR